ncbi:mitogen-activated protein kinase-binding protein 1-like isoform X3 [Ornithodoros turicata]|uniref:mitogen-activated protein kinase-binding protein 1-like isoform X3 n=1 Tax=Ornithodoros turicata TaxID=34597 RepID=UPI003138B5E1
MTVNIEDGMLLTHYASSKATPRRKTDVSMMSNSKRMDRSSTGTVPRIVRAPALKRGREFTPLSERVKLEKVLGLTVTSNAALDCDSATGVVAYPAGCVVVLYNTRKNKQQYILNASKKTITSLAFSWDGKYLATGECGHQPHLRVWDVQEKTQVAEFPGHKFGINCVAFSPNLKYVVSVGSQHDMVVNVWDWRNNVKVASNKVSSKVKAVSFSPSGNYFVTVGNRHVKFWYLEYSRTTKYKLEPVPLMGRSAILGDQRNNYFCGVACGKGDNVESTYAITKSGLLCVFNSRRLLDKWVELRTSCANSISVGKECIFVGCADGIVRCFDPRTLQFLATLPRPHYLGVDVSKGTSPSAAGAHPPGAKYPHATAIAFDEVNKRVTCIYNDHSLFVWNVADLKKIGKSHSYLFHSACIWGVETYPLALKGSKTVLPRGTFLTCSSDDTIRIWNLDPHSTQSSGVQRNIYCTELLRVLYMDPDMAYICDVDFQGGSNDKVDTTYDGKNGVRCLRISPDGQHLASGDRSGNIRVYGIQGFKEQCKIEAHDSEVLCLEYWTGSGVRLLASGSRDRFVHVFDVDRDYSFQQTLDDHSSSITAVRFVQGPADSLQMISCGADKSIIFRRAHGVRLLSGLFLASNSANCRNLFLTQSPHLSFTREHHVVGKTTLYDMEVDGPQRHVLAACQDRQVRVYAVSSGKNTRCFRGAQGEDGTLIKVVLDPTGTYLATSCTDKSLYVYEYSTGECVASMFGHSELVTGLKFSEDGKHLISVSGDGCIFVWRLPLEVTQAILSRQSGLDLKIENSWQESRKSAVGVTVPLSGEDGVDTASINGISTDSAAVSNASDNHSDNPPGYKFSMGPLPMWAKKQMMEEMQNSSSNSSPRPQLPPVPLPRGRWAQRLDNNAPGLLVKSYLENDAVIPFHPNMMQNNAAATTNGKATSSDDSSVKEGTHNSDFELDPESLTEILGPPPPPPRDEPNHGLGSVTVIRGGNLGGGGDTAAADRQPQRQRYGGTDSSSCASSMKMEDGDAEDEHSDTEGSEMVYYPHSEDSSELGDGSFQVRATTENDLKEARRRLRGSRIERPPSTYGSSDFCQSEVNSDEDDSSTTAEGDPRPLGGSMCVSTENLDKLGQRERFMKSNYESLDRSNDSDSSTPTPRRSSLSARYLVTRSGTQGTPSPTWASRTSGSKSDQEQGSHSKRREELTQALNQARQKLNALGWRSGLSTSKSIGDLQSLKDDESFNQSFSKSLFSTPTSRDDSIRRTASMTDISFSARRRLLPSAPDFNAEPSAGLWAQAKPAPAPAPQPPPVTTISIRRMQRNSPAMSRSASMGSLHGQSSPSAPSPLARVPSTQMLTPRGSALSKVRSMSALSRGQHLPLPPQLESDDSSSSDTEHVETSKARTSLNRVFASKDFSRAGRPNGHENPRALVEPMVSSRAQQEHEGSRWSGPLPGNPVNVPLTRELCERVADELSRVTSYAIQIFQRVTMDMELPPADKSTMTNTLAQGVLQAQQNLRPAAPPMPLWGAPPAVAPVAVTSPVVPQVAPPQTPPHLPNVPAVFQHYPAARRFVMNGTVSAQTASEVIQQPQMPLGRKGDQTMQSNSDMSGLLQQYSEQLMKMVEDRINKSKAEKSEKP